MPLYFRPFSSLWNNVNILHLPCYREQGQFIDWLDSGSLTHRTGNKPYCKCRIYVFGGSFNSAVFGSSYRSERARCFAARPVHVSCTLPAQEPPARIT